MPMPPEMVVHLRLLGFKREVIRHWMGEYHMATPEAWWRWVELLEKDPDVLRGARRIYDARTYSDEATR